jgi:hypothetical protein
MLASTSVVLALITDTSVEDPEFSFELGAAWALGIEVVPLLFGTKQSHYLPWPVRSSSPVRLEEPGAWETLVTELSDRLGALPRRPSPVEAPSATTTISGFAPAGLTPIDDFVPPPVADLGHVPPSAAEAELGFSPPPLPPSAAEAVLGAAVAPAGRLPRPPAPAGYAAFAPEPSYGASVPPVGAEASSSDSGDRFAASAEARYWAEAEELEADQPTSAPSLIQVDLHTVSSAPVVQPSEAEVEAGAVAAAAAAVIDEPVATTRTQTSSAVDAFLEQAFADTMAHAAETTASAATFADPTETGASPEPFADPAETTASGEPFADPSETTAAGGRFVEASDKLAEPADTFAESVPTFVEPAQTSAEPLPFAEPASLAATSAVFARLPTCEMSLEAGRAVSDCKFNRAEVTDFEGELAKPLGNFVDAMGGSWDELRTLKDFDVWLSQTEILIDSLPPELKRVKDWYQLGFELAVLHNLAGQLVLDGPDHSDEAEQTWRGALERFLERAENAQIGYENLGRVLALLENLAGPRSERDLGNISRSLQEVRRYAAGADGIHTAA